MYALPSRDSANNEDEEKNGDSDEGQTNESERASKELQTRPRPRAILTPLRPGLQN